MFCVSMVRKDVPTDERSAEVPDYQWPSAIPWGTEATMCVSRSRDAACHNSVFSLPAD